MTPPSGLILLTHNWGSVILPFTEQPKAKIMNIRPFNDIHPQLGNHVFIDDSAVVTGKVILGDDASVWPCVSIRGDLMPIKIGDRSNIQDGSVLHTTHASEYCANGFALTIGDDVTIGHNVTLHGCTIQDQSLIGMNAVVLDGAIVEKNVLVAAGSVVGPGKVLESGYLWLGNPIRKARPLTEKEIRFFLYSAHHYVKLKNQHQGHN